jgi:hypothetical protein
VSLLLLQRVALKDDVHSCVRLTLVDTLNMHSIEIVVPFYPNSATRSYDPFIVLYKSGSYELTVKKLRESVIKQ